MCEEWIPLSPLLVIVDEIILCDDGYNGLPLGNNIMACPVLLEITLSLYTAPLIYETRPIPELLEIFVCETIGDWG